MGVVLLLPLGQDALGTAAEAFFAQFAAIGVGEGQGGMCGGGAQRITPDGLCRRRGAAIHDQPVAPNAQLEGHGAGMREPVPRAGHAGGQIGRAARWWGAAIHNHQGAAALHAVEAGVLQQHWCAAAGLAMMQHQIDQRRRFIARAIE
jgi:hypothetical protein